MGVLAGLLCTSWDVGAATLYTGDGDPSASDELIRWHLNRTRFNPEAEADRLGLVNTSPGGSPDFDVAEDTDGVNDFGAGPTQWAAWSGWRQPLAPNANMSQATREHCQDMAATQMVQHPSPSSTFFPVNSSPKQRQAARGYVNTVFGYIENIAYGGRGSTGTYPAYGLRPRDAHERLFIDAGIADRGHRKTVLNPDARECGIGFHRRNTTSMSGSTLIYWTRDYHTHDVGVRAGHFFYTCTAFLDQNGNGVYDEGEGVEGIEVRLFVDGVESAWYDRTGSAGAFAVPMAGIAPGALVEVRLVNPGAFPVSLSIPQDHAQLGVLTLPAAGAITYGFFNRPATELNMGFRETPHAMRVEMAEFATLPEIRFNALAGLTYEVQYCTDLALQDWQPSHRLVADSDVIAVPCDPPTGTPGELPANTWRVYRAVRVDP